MQGTLTIPCLKKGNYPVLKQRPKTRLYMKELLTIIFDFLPYCTFNITVTFSHIFPPCNYGARCTANILEPRPPLPGGPFIKQDTKILNFSNDAVFRHYYKECTLRCVRKICEKRLLDSPCLSVRPHGTTQLTLHGF